MKEEAQRFFTNLFSIDVQVSRNYLLENATPTLSLEDRVALALPISYEEVRQDVMAMHLFKAPGLDGFGLFSTNSTRIS